MVILDLALDRDGILQVTAREKSTGLERRITIDKAMSRYDPAQTDAARARISLLFGDDDAGAAEGSVLEAEASDDADGAGLDALLAKASAKLDVVGEEDRNETIDLIETLRDARASGDGATPEGSRRQLEALLFCLET